MNQNVVIGALVIVVAFIAGAVFFLNQPAVDQDALSPSVTPGSNEITFEEQATPSPVVSGSPTVSPVVSGSPTPSSTGSVKSFTVNGSPFVFSLKEMRVTKGDTVNITFKNDSGTHDLTIDEYNVGTKVLQSGQSETIQFVADKAGTFEYYCSVGTHRQMGMKGSLIVQ